MQRLPLAFTAASLALCASLSRAQRHPFGPDDWASLRQGRPSAVSPDGKTIIYQVRVGLTKDGHRDEFWEIHSDGSDNHHLDLSPDFFPIGFMPDGKSLYGFCTVNDIEQIGVLPLEGLTAKTTPSRIISAPLDVQDAKISPDGKRFVFTGDPAAPDKLSKVHTVVQPDYVSLYVVNVDGTGGQWWAPTLDSVDSYAWSPDGKSIAVVSTTPKLGYHDIKSRIDAVTGHSHRLLAQFPNRAYGVAWADGGKDIAVTSTTNMVNAPDHVWIVPATGGKFIDRTPNLQGSAILMQGDARGNAWVEMHRGTHVETDLYLDGKLSLAYRYPAGSAYPPVTSDTVGSGSTVACYIFDSEHRSEVAVATGGNIRRLTNLNADVMSRVDLGQVRLVHWTSKEGVHLEGIATFPAGYVKGHRYPFVVIPHGGPEMSDEFLLDEYPRLFAGMGYVVLQPEYRGSIGYGDEFLGAYYQHFGDRSYRDVDSATDYAISQGWADPKRLVIMGWSIGGTLAAWTVTQTRRYKAAIDGGGITDWGSFIWTSDREQIDFDRRWPDKNPNAFIKFSPVYHVHQITTPILILHGADDVRVPAFQSREFYEALKASGKTARLVTYPGAPHNPVRMDQQLDLWREISAWVKKYNP